MSGAILTFLADLKFAARSLLRAKGLTLTVVLTLALGIGANSAIFSLVRGVLLRPLVNRDESRLIYIRQSAPGIGAEDADFSIPEIRDIESGMRTLNAFGDFSTIGFSMIGLGAPREVRSGVVNGTYFRVMGLHPVLGRLLDERDDGPRAAGAAVLTWRFWSTALKTDPSVLGKTIRLDTRTATVVGVLEPCVPYPADTEIIANVVTSPHHLSATMVTGRVHRMTELFGRLAPGATLDQARAELETVYGAMKRQYPEAYPVKAEFRISAVRLRDQITDKARTVLWVLLAASVLVFVIACSNVANLILARTVRREGELAIRSALGAGNAALRRILLAETLLLCVGGAGLGILLASPMVAVLARYAARFSIRALEIRVDSTLLSVGALLAVVAAVLLAFVPRLPSSATSGGFGLSNSSVRITGSTNRRLRVFAVIQIGASFVLLAGAGMVIRTLISLQSAQTGMDVHHVLAINVPVMSYGKTQAQVVDFYHDVMRRITSLHGVDQVAFGINVPWRDAGQVPEFQFAADGHAHGSVGEDPRAGLRVISPGFFAALGVPILAGRDFNDNDRHGTESVVIISQTLAQRIFPNGDAIDRHIFWTDPVMKFIDVHTEPMRIIGVAADIDDQHVVPAPTMTVYNAFGQEQAWGGRLFIHAHVDPYTLVTPVTRIIRGMSVEQPVEHAATLEDIRAEVLTPNRLNALVFGGFAVVALAIAVVGVAGVLAFSVSGRTREFGIRLAIGSQPHHLLTRVIAEGAGMAIAGLAAGAVCGYALTLLAGNWSDQVRMPGALAVTGSAVILLIAAVVASAWPAARAARVDVVQALRSE